jgi:hypothetical protein
MAASTPLTSHRVKLPLDTRKQNPALPSAETKRSGQAELSEEDGSGVFSYYGYPSRRSRVQVLPTRARNNDTWDRRHIVSNMR